MTVYQRYAESELAALLKKGDHAAFTEMFNRYHLRLFRFIYKKVQDEEVAKDVVQDVFVKIWNNRREFKLTTNLSSYLYKAVYNRSLDALKHLTVREEYIKSFQYMLDQTVEGADYDIREQDMERIIELEIAALPERMREVINLRRKEYLSNREIAQKLGISEQTVETHFKRAFRILRLRLRVLIPLAYLVKWWFYE